MRPKLESKQGLEFCWLNWAAIAGAKCRLISNIGKPHYVL